MENKLTAEQISLIEETLIEKGLVYEDIKLEFIDHIAIEIEVENQECTFEEAFTKSFDKWELLLKETSSLGYGIVGPKVIVERYTAIASKIFKSSLLSAFLFGIFVTTITIVYPQEYVYAIMKSVFASTYILSCTAIISSMFFVWKLKSKTVYGQFFIRSSSFLPFHFYMIYTLLNGHTYLFRYYHRESFFSNFIEWSITGFYFFISVFIIGVATEHFKIVKKYKLI